MKYYAVIDTNVIVAALLSKNSDAATVKIMKELAGGSIIPLYHSEILAEYEEVLSRDKFPIAQTTVAKILGIVRRFGVQANPVQTDEIFQDLDDRIFYEVAMARRDDGAYLVTGNKRHYPEKHFVVTPAEMIRILTETERSV